MITEHTLDSVALLVLFFSLVFVVIWAYHCQVRITEVELENSNLRAENNSLKARIEMSNIYKAALSNTGIRQ
jgi:cell division protein FtsL